MVTQETVRAKILAHLNHALSEQDLVQWAEEALLALTESDEDVPEEETIMEILTYLAAGDSPGFPLSWSVLSDFLQQLGTRVRVLVE